MLKEKITPHQFFLIINGPSCGGKSSVSDVLCATYGGIYKGKSDAIKWLISDYTPAVHRDVVHLMTNATIQVALAHGFSVIKEGAHHQPEDYVKFAKDFNIPLFIANIEAPWEVLVERFEERVEAKKQGKRIANNDPIRFKELFEKYHETKMDTPLLFDSSKQTPEEIAKIITNHIKKTLA